LAELGSLLSMSDPVHGMQIKGGAGPQEAAAIAAVVAAALEVERAEDAAQPRRRNLSAWALSTRHPRLTAPLRPTTALTRHAIED
jgi:hypothetical protein